MFEEMENLTLEEMQPEIESEQSFSAKRELFDWLEILATSLIALVVIFTFIFKVVTISGGSMQNTLYSGERVVITNIFYNPQPGDIVVISRHADSGGSDVPIIKRVIATEGQIVDIDFNKGIVYVDGVALDEPYTKTPTNLKYDIEFPVRVDEGCVFVLGDNRNDSNDSRNSRIGNNGMVDTRDILGKAVLRILPFSKFGDIYD